MRYKDLLTTFWDEEGYVPSYQGLCTLWGLRSKNAAYKIVGSLIEEGYLLKKEGKLVATDRLKEVGIPFYDDAVKAGFPAPIEEHFDERISLDGYLVDHPHDTICIRVHGDSMIGAGIISGDLVLVRKGVHIKDKDLIVAYVDQGYTLKHFRNSGGIIRLEAANPDYPTIYPEEDLTVVGKVCGIVRKYN